jgi:hypothetical protein
MSDLVLADLGHSAFQIGPLLKSKGEYGIGGFMKRFPPGNFGLQRLAGAVCFGHSQIQNGPLTRNATLRNMIAGRCS